jgi:hypothetical protein
VQWAGLDTDSHPAFTYGRFKVAAMVSFHAAAAQINYITTTTILQAIFHHHHHYFFTTTN